MDPHTGLFHLDIDLDAGLEPVAPPDDRTRQLIRAVMDAYPNLGHHRVQAHLAVTGADVPVEVVYGVFRGL